MYSKWVNGKIEVFDYCCICGEYHSIDCDYLSSPKLGQYDEVWEKFNVSGVTYCNNSEEGDRDHEHWDISKKEFDNMLNNPINLPDIKTIRNK